MQALSQAEASSQSALKAASPEEGVHSIVAVFDQAGARKAEVQAAEASDETPSEAPLGPSVPSAPATSRSGSVPSALGLGLEGILRRWGRLYLEDRELQALGQGDFGRVYAHPKDPGAVIKLVAFSAGALLSAGLSKEQAARLESLVGARLAAIGAGPKVLGTASIPGEPSRLRRRLWGLFGWEARVPERPAVVMERIYGETVEQLIAQRRFTRLDYDLIQRMLERMAKGRARASDLRPANVMIGRTLADAEPRAYLVDGGWLLQVKESESREELLQSLRRHQAPIVGGPDSSEGFWGENLTDPLDDVLKAGLARSAKR